MQALPKWRNVLMLKNSLLQQPVTTAATTVSSLSSHCTSFHYTPTSYEKWKNKWNYDVRKTQQPSKNYIRYATHQKRADAKKALKGLLYNCWSSRYTFEDACLKLHGTTSWDAKQTDHTDGSNKKDRAKYFARCANKARHSKIRRKCRRENPFEDYDEHPETIFYAALRNKWNSWSFKSWNESSFHSSTAGFDWREQSTRRTSESHDESCCVGSCSDRTLLGLPAKGPLKIEDVKNAFRMSALNWHPDRHQGPSQAMAEEKFKHCVNAYKSLCDALSTV